jgi:uncharacterized membrane protein
MQMHEIIGRLRFVRNRIRERLWIRPLAACLLSIAAVFVAKGVDTFDFGSSLPVVSHESLSSLLKIMASSMLVIAIFAVGSMIAAYSSASTTATPRSLPLVLSDDLSQNALSVFLGAFIFSVVGLLAVENDYVLLGGRYVLLLFILIALGTVVLAFVRWVDHIARLGRLATTIEMVEKAADAALSRRCKAPTLRGVPVKSTGGRPIFAENVGYVQRVDVEALQSCCESMEWRIVVAALPGTLAAPGRPLAHIIAKAVNLDEAGCERVIRAFKIGNKRVFDDDPRLGLVALSEIAARALSPAVNDPGTAIDIIGRMVRIFVSWSSDYGAEVSPPTYELVEVPELTIDDLFDDGFTAIARDGASMVEVAVRLQKAFAALAKVGDAAMRSAAVRHSQLALARAELELNLPEDLNLVRQLAEFTGENNTT